MILKDKGVRLGKGLWLPLVRSWGRSAPEANHTPQGVLRPPPHVALTHSTIVLHGGFTQVRASAWEAWCGAGKGGEVPLSRRVEPG